MKGFASVLYKPGYNHFVKVDSLRVSSITLTAIPLFDQVDLFFCGWPHCQATSFVCETDPCNQFQAYMLEWRSIFPSWSEFCIMMF